MNKRDFLKTALLLVSASPLLAAPPKSQPARPYGIFSDIEISRETGDAGGMDLFFFGADKDYVLVIEGEGGLGAPELCEVLKNGNGVEFIKNAFPEPVRFKGMITATHLIGKFSNGTDVKIPRKRSRLMSTFSDLALSKETGDAMGMEIVSFLANKPYVLILEGAGDLRPPQIVPTESDGKKLRFRFRRADGSEVEFRGTETKTMLSGVFSVSGQADEPVKLPSKKSFWE